MLPIPNLECSNEMGMNAWLSKSNWDYDTEIMERVQKKENITNCWCCSQLANEDSND